jgi:hypothetical protein
MTKTDSRRVFEQADGSYIVNEYDVRGTFIREVPFATEAEANKFASDVTVDRPDAPAPTITEEAHNAPVVTAPEAQAPAPVQPAPVEEVSVVDGQSQAPTEVAPEAPTAPAEVTPEVSAPTPTEDATAPVAPEATVPATPGEATPSAPTEETLNQ